MRRTAFVFPVLALALATGCASTTVIKSTPPGAAVLSQYGAVLGRTPYVHTDTNSYGASERFTLQLEGYEPAELVIRRKKWNEGRTVGFIIAGLIFWPSLIGLAWAQDYEPEYVIELLPEGTVRPPEPAEALPPPAPHPL